VQYYSDEQNTKGAYLVFIVMQVLMLLIVYGFIYTSLIAVKLAITEYHLTFMAYMPVIIALVAYPVVLYKSRKMFLKHKRLRAIGWVLGWASVIIVALYVFLSQLIPV
jgi:hypothetical protein